MAGILFNNDEVFRCLTNKARKIAKELNVQGLELRHAETVGALEDCSATGNDENGIFMPGQVT